MLDHTGTLHQFLLFGEKSNQSKIIGMRTITGFPFFVTNMIPLETSNSKTVQNKNPTIQNDIL